MRPHPRLHSVFQQALQRNASPQMIQLVVGELLFDEAALRHQWHELAKHTPLVTAQLNIRVIPAEQQCMVCFLVYHPNEKETACPQCKSVGAKIISGEELYLELD